eukprot:TRINITY_DN33458_c0_g1_i1.p9 TRINITY_DN33458_c0_g1~~TRINITY_DN33458_c0_g1_i1.p9  ORF type:complete len:108 (+),score=4.54 TRINITY_DN33458_c0_g1_i1:191-514(+)
MQQNLAITYLAKTIFSYNVYPRLFLNFFKVNVTEIFIAGYAFITQFLLGRIVGFLVPIELFFAKVSDMTYFFFNVFQSDIPEYIHHDVSFKFFYKVDVIDEKLQHRK